MCIYYNYVTSQQTLVGTTDITLWEESGRNSRRLKIGQYVLLDHLVTSDKQSKEKPIWYVNGSMICGTKLYNSRFLCLGCANQKITHFCV